MTRTITASDREEIQQAAAAAALAAPGVAALQPALADRLALAASRVYHAMTAGTASHHEAAGIRCEHTPEGGWHVEVRCVLHADRRVVDTARQVREDVWTAVTTCLTRQGATRPVRVLVTVTRTV
ncbi:hypothetical protein PV721_23390 [Streptomyces sp. MB09-01]|uniref:hypothetical protein n=1 Tax=Streptomyces sp. MB09-01 TaxID=3028666 RepID=UPI0029B7CC78|nr:hypothetical protein [Streptomyces sp. MB09-01]MDX3537265.1 hypothetical protein [Streptomyces sp. MB09-01]